MTEVAEQRQDGDPRPELSESQEDYLKQIFLLGGDRDRVSTQALARRLHVKPASVTEMVGRLSQLGLVEHAPYYGVRLTDGGRRVALEMLRHHRLLETFLVEALRLEHVISERFEERIAEAMGHPTHDPHGDPIPAPDLSLPVGDASVPLQDLPVGARGALVRVGAQDPDNLNLLRRLGLEPGCTVEVVSEDERGIRVRVGEERFLLPGYLTEMLWMERLE